MLRIGINILFINKFTFIIILNLLFFTQVKSATITSVSTGDWSASAWPNTNRSGTITTSTNSITVTGTSTSFTTELSVGNIIKNSSNDIIGTVASIQNNTSLTLVANANSTNTDIAYKFQGVGPIDVARISSGHTVTIDGDFTCSGLTFISNTTISKVNFDTNRTYNFIINGTASFANPAADNIYNILEIGSNNVTINTITFSSLSTSRINKISLSTGSLKCKGNFQTAGSVGSVESTSSATVTFSGTVSALNINISGSGSTYIYASNGAQTVRPANYYNLSIGGAGAKTTAFVTVNGTLSIDSVSTLSTLISYGSNAKLRYNTSINRTVTATEWPSTFTPLGGVEIANTGQITMNASKTFQNNSPLIINSGATLNTNSFDLTFGGDFTNNGNLNAGSSNFTINGTATSQNIGGISTTGALTFSKSSGSATFNDSIIVLDFFMSEIGGTLNLGTSTFVINGIFYLSQGTLNLNSGNLYLVDVVNYLGGTLNANQGNIIYTGNNQNIIPINYYNLTFKGNGNSTFTSTNTIVLNNLNIEDSVILYTDGNLIISGNLNIKFKGNLLSYTDTIKIAGNITIDSLCYLGYEESTLVFNGNGIQTFSTATQNQFIIKNISIQNGTKIFNSDLKVSNSLSILENSTLQLGENFFLEIAGAFSAFNSTSTIKAASCGNASNTLTLSGNSTMSTIYFENGYQHFKNFYLPKTGSNLTFGSDFAVNGEFNFSNGSSVLFIAGELNLYGNNLSIVNISNRVYASTNFSLRFGNYISCGVANTSSINIPDNFFNYYPSATEYLIVDLSPNTTVTLGTQNLYLKSILEIKSGNLSLSGGITLASTSTTTARVLPIPTGSTVSGNFTIERFIPGGVGKRKWRLLSSPINVSGSISLLQFKDDIFVTAPSGSNGNFDVNPFGTNASIRTYNETTSGSANSGWTDPTNISNTISTGSAVEVFVRGSRNLANPYLNWTTPDDVTIDFIGALNYGNISKSLSYTNSNNSSADGFNLIGNPYASPINFDTSGWTKTNIKNQYWSYNPNTGMYGIYDGDLQNGTNGITKYISSGQGFFVKAISTGASIQFTENIKCINNPGNTYYRSSNYTLDSLAILKITLENDSSESDETLIYLSENGSTTGNDLHDATKFYNDALNIYTTSDSNAKLAINEYPYPSNSDTINLSVWSYDSSAIMKTHHRISIDGANSIPNNIGIFLLDKFNNTITDTRNLSYYDFQITDNTNSYGNNRFKLILRNNSNSVESIKSSGFTLFPNPTSTLLNIFSNQYFKNETHTLEIYNVNGQLVKKQELQFNDNTASVNVESLEKGVYILKIDGVVKYFIKN